MLEVHSDCFYNGYLMLSVRLASSGSAFRFLQREGNFLSAGYWSLVTWDPMIKTSTWECMALNTSYLQSSWFSLTVYHQMNQSGKTGVAFTVLIVSAWDVSSHVENNKHFATSSCVAPASLWLPLCQVCWISRPVSRAPCDSFCRPRKAAQMPRRGKHLRKQGIGWNLLLKRIKLAVLVALSWQVVDGYMNRKTHQRKSALLHTWTIRM